MTGPGGSAPPGLGSTPRARFEATRRAVVDHGSPIFAGVVALVAVGYFVASLRYDRGSLASPGPGLFPEVVAVVLFVAAVGTAWTTRRAAPPSGNDLTADMAAAAGAGTADAAGMATETEPEHRPLRPVAVVLGAVLFVTTLSSIGFFFAAALVLVVVSLGMGVRNPFRVVLFAVLLALASQALFVDLLGIKFFTSVHVLPGS